MTDKLLLAEKTALRPDVPPFAPGDTVKVHVKVKEGEKERFPDGYYQSADGHALVPERPGNGLVWNAQAVEQYRM